VVLIMQTCQNTKKRESGVSCTRANRSQHRPFAKGAGARHGPASPEFFDPG